MLHRTTPTFPGGSGTGNDAGVHSFANICHTWYPDPQHLGRGIVWTVVWTPLCLRYADVQCAVMRVLRT